MKTEEIFAGTGVGILTGLLIGLSVSPVVGPVLGAFLAFGMLWLGYKEHQNVKLDTADAAAMAHVRSAIATRLGFFCFACAAGLLLGLFLRTNNVFAPTLESRRDQWIQLGYSKDQANAILVQKELQFSTDDESTRALASALYAFPTSSEELAIQLDPNEHKNDLESCIVGYERKGNEWAEAATKLRKIHDPNALLCALEALYCISQGKER